MIIQEIPFKMKTEPYAHQREGFNHSKDMKYFGLFWEMGVGKSKTIIDTSAYLYCRGEIDGVLIVSDKGAYLSWYYEEIEKHLMSEIPRRLSFWSSSSKAPDKLQMEKLMHAKDDCLDFMCVNIEALSSPKAQEACSRFLRSHYSMMVVDEATSIKNPKADRTKACWQLGQLCEYRRIATGTPITQSPLDLFGMCQFLEPGSLLFPSFVPFKAYYAQVITMTLGMRSFPKIVGYRNLEILTKTIQPFTSRVLKEECLDLPEKLYEKIFVDLTPEQQSAYDNLRSTALIEFAQGLLTSTSALTTINKLQQIVCGHVKLDEGTVVDIPNNRVKMLIDLLDTLDEKAVIWCAFQRDVELIMAAIKERFEQKDLFAVHYYGKTTASERQFALDNFKQQHKCRWFVGTAATGGKGLNQLVGARYVAYYSNTYVLEDRLQSEDRNHRIGQTQNVTYFDLVTPDTTDIKILKSLELKEDLAHQVLDNFRDIV